MVPKVDCHYFSEYSLTTQGGGTKIKYLCRCILANGIKKNYVEKMESRFLTSELMSCQNSLEIEIVGQWERPSKGFCRQAT